MLKSRLGAGAVLTGDADLFVHGFDATMTPRRPEVVAIPASVEELAWSCETLWDARVATTIRGAGTGFSGGAVPAAGGAVVVCDHLRGITAPSAGVVEVEPGVVGDDLNRYLKPGGWFYPVDPASAEASTLGGHVAENAGGPRALKYGVTRDYVAALDVLSPARGRETYDDKPGRADALGLLVGSEGTLAVFLRIRVRVIRLPEAVVAGVASFAKVGAAADAALAVLAAGLLPSKLEFLDRRCVECVNAARPGAFDARAAAVLMFEFDGAREEAAADLAAAAALAKRAGASRLVTAADETAAAKLWEARRGVSPALGILAPHKLNEDVCVPRSRLAELLSFIRGLEKKFGLAVPTFGHIGDGNLHVNFMFDRRDAGAAARAEKAVGALMARVVAVGGTVTGEHGIGLTKTPFLKLEWAPGAYGLARRLKAFFDPDGVLNPGKITG